MQPNSIQCLCDVIAERLIIIILKQKKKTRKGIESMRKARKAKRGSRTRLPLGWTPLKWKLPFSFHGILTIFLKSYTALNTFPGSLDLELSKHYINRSRDPNPLHVITSSDKQKITLFEFNSRPDHQISMKFGMQVHQMLVYKLLLQTLKILFITGYNHWSFCKKMVAKADYALIKHIIFIAKKNR